VKSPHTLPTERRPDDQGTGTEVDRPAELLGLVGTRVGTSPWLEVSQADVDSFARLTRDQQWIHVDRERAAAGPFGTTIAHGFFVLSLCAYFTDSTLTVRGVRMGINYGLDRVRFTSPVAIGSWIRAQVYVESADEIENGVQLKLAVVVEIDGQSKPACVAVMISRLHE
jgi:acyl dehydratase